MEMPQNATSHLVVFVQGHTDSLEHVQERTVLYRTLGHRAECEQDPRKKGRPGRDLQRSFQRTSSVAYQKGINVRTANSLLFP